MGMLSKYVEGSFSMDNLIGEQYGNYRLTKKLGEGGFGYVYLAENIHTHHLVAIKLPNERIPPGAEEMFFEEARTISQFAHPHIARLLDFGVKDNVPYLVIEYAEQGSLRDRHPRGTYVDLTTVIAYVKQLTEALKYAHSRRITHRDIKPENFLMRSRDEILLSDFGIAIDSYTWRHTPQNAAGSVYYIAPEQVRGKAESASDQYSLAITVYEWLCGTVPFKGTRDEIERQHKNDPPPPLHSYISIAPSVEKVILKALAKEPEQRFGSIQEFAQALEQAYQEQINNLLEQSALTLDLLQYEHVQHMLLDLVLTNPQWWNDSGRAKIVDLRMEAESNLSLGTSLKKMLAALAAKAIERLITVIEHEDWEGCSNFLHLIMEAAPPSTASVTWVSLLKRLSSRPRVIEALRKNWQIHSFLLEQWGYASFLPTNDYIGLWFPTTWPEFWPFLSLTLPEEWYDAALAHLLTTTANTVLPPDIVRSIEAVHIPVLESYMRRSFSTYAYRSRTVILFATLVKGGYAEKMKLLSILLPATDVPQEKRQDYMEAVLKDARLTGAERVDVLEQQWSQLKTSSHLTVVLDSISQYLLAFSINDLSRPSAKKFLQRLHERPSLLLSKESLQLAKSWHVISLFFERPTISKAQLRSLANAIWLLPAALYEPLMATMNELFIVAIGSEASLMCVTEAMSTFLTDQELLRFLHLLAEGAGNAYKQKRLETFLVPYILIAFQTETIFQTLSSAEQREFTAQFLSALLCYADKRTYQKLTTIAQYWSTPLATKWREYVSKYRVKDTTSQIQNVRLTPSGNTGTTAGRMAVPEIKKHKDGVDGNSAPVSPATAIRKPLFSRKRVLLLIILVLLIGGSSSGLAIIHVNQVVVSTFVPPLPMMLLLPVPPMMLLPLSPILMAKVRLYSPIH
jgi:Protein kinase domain